MVDIQFAQLMDFLEPQMESGGNIVEYHSCDFFPERWFDAVFVIQCNNTILYDRLQERGYNERKIKENIECEIFQMVLNEAKESYAEDIITPLQGESESDFVESIKQITDFIDNFNKWNHCVVRQTSLNQSVIWYFVFFRLCYAQCFVVRAHAA